jgi:uncharacterized membrane protein YphA (DoxX/SURF4 family)
MWLICLSFTLRIEGAKGAMVVKTLDLKGGAAPSWVLRVMAAPAIQWLALLGLCSAYLQGGLDKAFDFAGAINEIQHFGLSPAVPLVVATIITEIAASALILAGYYRWFGALWLAGFTLMATFIANRFWELPMPDRLMVENGFFEHLGLVGGFILVAWYDLRTPN